MSSILKESIDFHCASAITQNWDTCYNILLLFEQKKFVICYWNLLFAIEICYLLLDALNACILSFKFERIIGLSVI